MNAKEIFGVVAPIVEHWNAVCERVARLSAVRDGDTITISPVERSCDAHLPGSVVTDIAMLSSVYGFGFGIHSDNNGSLYILI